MLLALLDRPRHLIVEVASRKGRVIVPADWLDAGFHPAAIADDAARQIRSSIEICVKRLRYGGQP
jgi:hypothetical protein